MYTINKDSKHLFLRLSNFFEYDSVEETKKSFAKNGYIWILKTGRKPSNEFLDDVINSNGGIILSNSSRKNKKYYYCKLDTYNPRNEKIVYPSYYDEYLQYENYSFNETIKNETWLKISSFIELTENEAEQFLTIKSNRKITECIQSRAVYMYLYCNNILKVKEK
jgi:hypothetical protein